MGITRERSKSRNDPRFKQLEMDYARMKLKISEAQADDDWEAFMEMDRRRMSRTAFWKTKKVKHFVKKQSENTQRHSAPKNRFRDTFRNLSKVSSTANTRR